MPVKIRETKAMQDRRFVRYKFAERLKRVRKQLGVSQEDLADKAGVSRSYLSEVEHARHLVGIEFIIKIAEALNVSASALLDNLGEEGSNDKH